MKTFLLALALLCLALPAQAKVAVPDPAYRKAQEWIATVKGADAGQLTELADDNLGLLFPGWHFFTLRFKDVTPEHSAPDSLKAVNILAISPALQVTRVGDDSTLRKFFADILMPAVTDDIAKEVVAGWLKLAEEFHHDGTITFNAPSDIAVTHQGDTVNAFGKVTAAAGGTGEITVTLSFNAKGRLTGHVLAATVAKPAPAAK